ncbi:MAG TPA: aminoglycoside phosphotransferase family protein [Streptosporangiaceae bacterium]|nr:aminoglycoside phosphotransferase family protein [Streptosporangiaceae bacterium]
MREQPGHLDQRDLARILREQWGLVPGRLRHLPVGFGDHHWELTGAAGGRWFVTVAELAGGWRGAGPAAGFADLRASMETVTVLHRAGLEFAVAPVPTTGGQALAPLGAGHAVAVFPYVDGAAGDFGDGLPGRDRLALIGILARLHGATPLARRTALARSPTPASRPALEAALGELGQPWSGGPYSGPVRRLLARHAARLGRALARFDELVGAAAGSGPPVITHGEPHPGNIMRSGGRLLLIDWDTAGLALPERDLWLGAGDDARAAGRYAELTGRRVSGAAMDLYRLRWRLDDIALSVRDFRAPHEQNKDSALMWDALTEEIGEIG